VPGEILQRATMNASGEGSRPGLIPLAWMPFALSVVPVAFLVGDQNPELALRLVGLATITLGVVQFFKRGGRIITAFGVFALAVAVFGGVGALAMGINRSYSIDRWTLIAALIVYVSGVLVAALLPQVEIETPKVNRDPTINSVNYFLLGPIFLSVGVALSFSASPLGPTADVAAYIGAVISIALAFQRPKLRTPMLGLLLWITVAVALGLYVWRFFDGFGRLNVASLGLCAALLSSMNSGRKGRWTKLIVLISLPAATIVGGYFGISRDPSDPAFRSASTAEVVSEGKGLESVISPLSFFSELLRRDGQLSTDRKRANGSTFVTSALIWVPRSVWPDKPLGFGRIIAVELVPNVAPNHSEAAFAEGEWYYNFGYLGFVLMIPITVLCLYWLDLKLRDVFAFDPRSRTDFLKRVAVVLVVGGIADYVWGGSFTFANRGGLRAAAVLMVLAVSVFFKGAARNLRKQQEEPRELAPSA
jgi:hypothetical protein